MATQSDVYREVALPLVDAVFDGVNGCVLAYGQTGAGKTYTVVGEDVDVIRGTEQGAARLGIVPRVAHDVFERIERMREEEESGGGGDRTWYAVRCSYVQVYLDECYDLLGDHPETRSSWGARTSDVNRLYPNEESLVR